MKNFERFKEKLKKDLQKKQQKNNGKFSTKSKLTNQKPTKYKQAQSSLTSSKRDFGL